MFMAFADDPAFGEVLECPLVAALLHEQELLAVPLVQIGGLDEGVHDAVLPMLARAVDAQMHAEVDGRPGRVFLLAVDADLYY